MPEINQSVKVIKDYYNVELFQVIENEMEYSKVEFYKNENKFALDSDANVIKLNLKDNSIFDLEGLLVVSKTLSHLVLAGNNLKNINLISKFKKLKYLDLGSNKISDITGLKNLKELESLYLDNNQISILPKLDLPLLEELWVYSNKIVDVFNLQYLTSLRALNISDNLIENISYLSKLNKLSDLRANTNKIFDISALSKFNIFRSLDLSNNQIINILPLKNISIERDLMIGENKIFDLTPIYHAVKRKEINFINAFDNPLIYPPIEVSTKGELFITEWFDSIISAVKEKINEVKESKSEILDIGRMGLTDLSLIPELFELKNLKELIISNEWAEYNDRDRKWIRKESKNTGLKNNIFNIPSQITKLSSLEKLITGGDWKSKYDIKSNNWRLIEVSHLFKLKKLFFLNISNNQVHDISGIENLKELEVAHLNNNQIINVPKLSDLNNLKELYLSNNLIEDTNFLNGCLQLVTVDLHSNKISNLIKLENLLKDSLTDIDFKNSSWEKEGISISNNSPNIVPPYEVLEQSKEGFFLYVKQMNYESVLKLDSYQNKEIKIILIGNSNSGKSTMLNYLKTERVKKNTPITHWLVTEELHNVKIDDEIFKLRFFDFGGQDYYHDTHKIFFSSDCVYLLLWDNNSNRLGEIEDKRGLSSIKTQVFPLEYWLDSIKIYAKKSLSESQRQMEQLLDERDLKIGLKINDLKKGRWTDDVIQASNSIRNIIENKNVLIVQNKIEINKGYLNQLKLVNDYNNIADFVDISLFENMGKKQFQELFLDSIKKNVNFKKPLLATWGYVKDNWINIFKTDDFVITMEIFKKRINSYISTWLKDTLRKTDSEISKILFKDEEITLFAQFLREIGLVLYSSKGEGIEINIIVDPNKFINEVHKILEISKNNKGKINLKDLSHINFKDEVIRTLVKHNIIFEEFKGSDFIAPLFLPEKPDALIDLLADTNKVPYRRFRFKGFIPKSIILSIFSKVRSKQKESNEDFYYWKNGLIFKDESTHQKVFLKFNIGNDHGSAYIDLFSLISNKDNSFIKKFSFLIKEVIEQEGIKINELLTLDGVYFVDLEKLKYNYDNKIFYTTIKDFNYKKNKQVSVYSFNKLLDDNMRKPAKKLFISYSKQDEKLVNNFIEHLSSLQSSGIIESWYCTELKSGDDWDVTINEKLNEADIICFMISPKFMSTPYIHKYEVKNAFKRYEKGDDLIIIPIVLDFIDWSRPYHFRSESGEELTWKLNKFSAVPFTLKPIVDFKENQNKAWYTISYGIKVVAEEDINLITMDEDEIVRKFPPDIKKIYEDIIEDNV